MGSTGLSGWSAHNLAEFVCLFLMGKYVSYVIFPKKYVRCMIAFFCLKNKKPKKVILILLIIATLFLMMDPSHIWTVLGNGRCHSWVNF